MAGIDLEVAAKLDTGAKTASLSARDIKRFKRDGESWVRFYLAIDAAHSHPIELPLARVSKIKRRSGDYDPDEGKAYTARPVVTLNICMGTALRTIEVNLTDRSAFQYPLLIGSEALNTLPANPPASPTLKPPSNLHAFSYPSSESPDRHPGGAGYFSHGLSDFCPGNSGHRRRHRRPVEHRRQGRVRRRQQGPGEDPDVRAAPEDYVSLNESFISNNYGVSVNRTDGNRKVTWSARRVSGKQTLYYRLVLTKRYTGEKPKVKGPTFRDSMAIEGPEKVAAEALMAPIRQHSADVETFIGETIKRVNNLGDDNVKLLLAGDPSTAHKAQIIELLLSIAHVPLEKVHTIRLVADQPQTPELWLRSFNGSDWLYFNPDTGEQGLPEDRLVWWTGDDNLISVEGGKKASVNFSLNNSEMNAIRLAKLTDENSDANFLEYSLYGLPLQTQQTFMIMVMIPIGVLVILILRNLIGLQTLGTFTPVLIALAFRETQLGFGIVLFTIITALGLSLRSYLEHLKLQMLPRLSVVLTFVVVLIAAISLFSHKLGLERGLSVALFPMVILTMTIERLSITWEERGGGHAMKVAIGTLFAASLAHLIMSVPELVRSC